MTYTIILLCLHCLHLILLKYTCTFYKTITFQKQQKNYARTSQPKSSGSITSMSSHGYTRKLRTSTPTDVSPDSRTPAPWVPPPGKTSKGTGQYTWKVCIIFVLWFVFSSYRLLFKIWLFLLVF